MGNPSRPAARGTLPCLVLQNLNHPRLPHALTCVRLRYERRPTAPSRFRHGDEGLRAIRAGGRLGVGFAHFSNIGGVDGYREMFVGEPGQDVDHFVVFDDPRPA